MAKPYFYSMNRLALKSVKRYKILSYIKKGAIKCMILN
jgi:hypothetical protein